MVDSFNVWSIGAKLWQPIFHAGELRAKRRSAADAYDAAAQAYGQAVLESLQQVADSLRVLEADALVLQARAEQSAASYAIARQRFEVGGISELTLLDAEPQDLQASLDRSHADAQRLADTAALLHALAGPGGTGWARNQQAIVRAGATRLATLLFADLSNTVRCIDDRIFRSSLKPTK